MREFFNKPVLFLLSLALCVLVSLFFFLFSSQRMTTRMFYFPDNRYENMDLEKRSLPLRAQREENISLFIRDLILGPVELKLAPFLPHETRLNTLMLRDKVLYMDFSREIMDFNDEIPLEFREIEELLSKNIMFNFKGIERLHITIDGQIPGEPFVKNDKI